jgi:hypothetical protein
MPVGRGPGQPQGGGRLLDRQAGEQPQLDDLDGRRVFGAQPARGLVEKKQVVGRFEDPVGGAQFDPPPPTD